MVEHDPVARGAVLSNGQQLLLLSFPTTAWASILLIDLD
jgi:hypothetical protein